MEMQKQLIKYFGMAVVLSIVALVVFLVFIPDRLSWAAFASPAFFASVSIISALIITNPSYTKFSKFSAVFMLSNVVKLLIYFVFLIAAFTNISIPSRVPFLVFFLSCYLVYAISDTRFMLSFFKKQDKQ